MLTPSELTAMRAEQEKTLQDMATVAHRAYQSDGAGGQTETLTYEDFPCRVAPSSYAPDYQIFAGVANETQLWRIAFPALTPVKNEDMVMVGARSFEVVGVLGPATFETARVVICVER